MPQQKGLNQDPTKQKWDPADYAYKATGGSDDREPISISNFLIEDEPTTCTIIEYPDQDNPREGKFGEFFTVELDTNMDNAQQQWAVNFSSKRFMALLNRIKKERPQTPVNVELVRTGRSFDVAYYGKIVE